MIGPTGSGKTLLAETLARTLDVHFAVCDATSLTESGYVGEDVENILLRLIQAADWDVSRAEHGIIYIDELDKIGHSYRGDPLSVLLEVLDPEQNREFLDHYLDLHYDLSNVLFIGTSNLLHPIHPPHQERREIITFTRYITSAKQLEAPKTPSSDVHALLQSPREPKRLKLQQTSDGSNI